jgi:hypothetical protein
MRSGGTSSAFTLLAWWDDRAAHGLAEHRGAGRHGLAGIHAQPAPDSESEAGGGDGSLLARGNPHGGCDRGLAENEGPNCTNSKVGRDGKVQLNLYDPDLPRVEFLEFAATKEPCCSPLLGKQPGPVEDNSPPASKAVEKTRAESFLSALCLAALCKLKLQSK